MQTYEGPTKPISIEIDKMKYCQKDETFNEKVSRIARTLADDDQHKSSLKDILIDSLNNKVRHRIDWIFTNGIIKLFRIKNINLLRLISLS